MAVVKKDLVTLLEKKFNKEWWFMIYKFYYSTVLIQIYFVQLIYCFYDNHGELNDDNYFKFYSHQNTV